MTKILFAAMLLAASAPAFADPAAVDAPVVATKGKMLLSSDGVPLASISRVTPAGPQIIFDGHMVTVPADTIRLANGKLTTILTKNAVGNLQ